MNSGVSFAALDPDTEERFFSLRRDLGVTSFGINQILLRPGQRGRIHLHTTQEEVYLVLAGTLTLWVEGEPKELGQGELARVGPEVRRQIANRGEENVLLLALGGAGEHVGRDGEAFESWEDRNTARRRRKSRSRATSDDRAHRRDAARPWREAASTARRTRSRSATPTSSGAARPTTPCSGRTGGRWRPSGWLVVDVQAGGERFHVVGVGGVIVTRDTAARAACARRSTPRWTARRRSARDRAMLFCSRANNGRCASFGFAEIDRPGRRRAVDGGEALMPPPAMWRPLRDGAAWPDGDVRLPELPF